MTTAVLGNERSVSTLLFYHLRALVYIYRYPIVNVQYGFYNFLIHSGKKVKFARTTAVATRFIYIFLINR